MTAWLSRHRRRLASAVLILAAGTAAAQEPPPQYWIEYARLTGNELQARLSDGPGDLITRLHDWLGRRQRREGFARPIVLRVWISPEGWIERSEFDSLGSAQADADLRAALALRSLPEPPPKDLRQPLVLRLTLRPNPDFNPRGTPDP